MWYLPGSDVDAFPGRRNHTVPRLPHKICKVTRNQRTVHNKRNPSISIIWNLPDYLQRRKGKKGGRKKLLKAPPRQVRRQISELCSA